MTNESGKHAVKQAKRKETHPGLMEVKPAPALEECLYNVLHAVSKSSHFDGDTIEQLQRLASGEMSAQQVAWFMVEVEREIDKHSAATNDYKAADAWREVISELRVPQRGDSPFMLVESQRAKGRG